MILYYFKHIVFDKNITEVYYTQDTIEYTVYTIYRIFTGTYETIWFSLEIQDLLIYLSLW